ncbi:MAG: 2,3-bisphosphoglycerate-independent phosphoglycerate mutase [Proteobacteria bacterium]|nr:2,3-bisphosphoglycerate-independent phosphoglycerate mutase [Pseudomonadota bacterium]MBU1709581.1 2,3-bisphosphoglycerate-independent phosphoglycerate mutase [Pseudomonadota bacterium]
MNKKAPLLLAILDGWGSGAEIATNAVYVADTPNMDKWSEEFPMTTLVAHNGAVGLPEGQMGNSEVGHLNIGAGRIVYQDFTRINKAIDTGEFFANEVLTKVMDHISSCNEALHLLGLLSDGGVHSHIRHLVALVRMAKDKGIEKIFIHAFMDGRDTPPEGGAAYMEQLQQALAEIGAGRVATVTGRYYAMDRDKRWDRLQMAWQCLVDGHGVQADDPVQAVRDAYERGETDEFIKPMVITDTSGTPVARITDNDAVIFFNFRADRVRQLTHALTDKVFDEFSCAHRPKLADCVTFTQYEKDFDLPVAFPPQELRRILGEEVSRQGLRQLRIAETEKYAHVTYFFNGGIEEPFPGEDRVLIPSPKEVATYDLKPEMSAYLVTEELLKRLKNEDYSLIILNFANGDMVGHSGKIAAAVKACEAVDQCLGKLYTEIIQQGGTMLITSDHGNAELMEDPETGEPFTAHTLNPVPFLVVGERLRDCTLRNDGTLVDIAPTILNILEIPVPDEMGGRNLIEC